MLLWVVVLLHFNTQHMNCQGTRFSFSRFSQIKSNQSITLFFLKIATLRYTWIFKASFFSNPVSCETAIYFNLCDLFLVTQYLFGENKRLML